VRVGVLARVQAAEKNKNTHINKQAEMIPPVNTDPADVLEEKSERVQSLYRVFFFRSVSLTHTHSLLLARSRALSLRPLHLS
jgi:hypothetical protein